ncbi:MAG: TIGR03943 family protein [Ilumatobacter sp.]
MFLIGIVVMRLVISGEYGFFVQQRMQIPLAVAGVLLLVFGVIELVAAFRSESSDPEASTRSISPTVGWLLAAPLVVLLAVAPAALGAAAAERVDSIVPAEPSPSDDSLQALDDSGGPVPLKVSDFLTRAIWDDTGSLIDTEVELEGLVVNADEIDDGFWLTRFAVSCCAADGLPLQVAIRGVEREFDNDEWVRVVVVWNEPPGGEYGPDDLIEARLVDIEVVENPPNDPYESPF